MFLILIETIGNSLILIPSGGINSPYVWYSLNTILIAAFYLNSWYSWINLSFYLICSTIVVHYFIENNQLLLDLIAREKNLILSYILITAIIQLLRRNSENIDMERAKTTELNKDLHRANQRIKDNLDYTMELYQVVHFIMEQKELSSLLKIIVEYTGKITKENSFILVTNSGQQEFFESIGIKGEAVSGLKSKIKKMAATTFNSDTVNIEIDNKNYLITLIKTNYNTFAVMGIEKQKTSENQLEQLELLGRLTAIMLDKIQLQQMNNDFLINEEQNRIANEIHDGILQRLFNASCGIYCVMKALDKEPTYNLKEQLATIKNTINTSMKELRATVYGLSWNKYGDNAFNDDIKTLIKEIRNHSNISVECSLQGNHEYLTVAKKSAIYRIINESLANAVRHSKGDQLMILLNMERELVSLKISDNGVGFDVREFKTSNRVGLGLKNITNLTEVLGGTINLYSEIGVGTTIEIKIPNRVVSIKEEAV